MGRQLLHVTGDPASGMAVALTIGVGEKSTSAPPPGVRRAAVRRRTGARPDHPHALSVPCTAAVARRRAGGLGRSPTQ